MKQLAYDVYVHTNNKYDKHNKNEKYLGGYN